ncbi:DUF4913 domain-containing protein [Streptomyces misionensis]|uniref:DUF4913 domain-containing protein n=1 Tax=Streptomyces misionensis TaxID=67331 RepID=UPI0037F10C75
MSAPGTAVDAAVPGIPPVCGYTGPSVWHRDHLEPALRELRASNQPFAGCVKGEHQVAHRLPSLVPSAWTHAED